ncbi:MAG: endopeptidase La [Sulfobacillus sp.]
MARLPEVLPLLPLRGVVVFPTMVVPLEVGRERSVRALDQALAGDRRIVFACQRVAEEEDPSPDTIFSIGTLAEVKQVVRLPGGGVKALVEGLGRVRITAYTMQSPYLAVAVEDLATRLIVRTPRFEALVQAVLKRYEETMKLSQRIPAEAMVAPETDDPGQLADAIAANLELPQEERQQLLEALDVESRLKLLLGILVRQVEMLELEQEIVGQVRQQLQKNQREMFLREQMKAIQHQLGDGDDDQDPEGYLRKVEAAGMPEEIRVKAVKEVERLSRMQAMSPEASVSRTYLEWLTAMPWATASVDRLDLKRVEAVLAEDHAGLEQVKTRIVEFLAVKQAAPEHKGPILCLVGPPGVGKTSIGRSVARALERSFTRVSLGGIRDEAEIRGHRRTYIGALPGRVIQGIRQAGTNNPVFLLDEIDKVGLDYRGDPSSALLEVLDPDQNTAFSDHYLEVAFDLSHVFFITTANSTHTIPRPLLDRMEVVEMSGYTEEEKVQIAKGHLLPQLKREHGLERTALALSDETVLEIIRHYTKEAGVRQLKRQMATILRKLATRRVRGHRLPRTPIRPDQVASYLGPSRFEGASAEVSAEVGIATGMYWSEVGGDVMPVEVSVMPGRGQLLLTGQLGDVMRESAQAGFSYVRAHWQELGVAEHFYRHQDVHIHVPDGSAPKEGPSAGVTMATALVSALTERPVRSDLAMTGEVTLRGRVLPIGGLKEKVLAAHRVGIRTVIIPQANVKDLADIPTVVRQQMTFVPVRTIAEVLDQALLPAPSN